MSTLAIEKRLQFKEVFDFYDRDNDGQLTNDEFNDALKSLGIVIPRIEMNEIFNTIPKKSYKYFERVASYKMPKKTNQDELVKAFGFLDKDGNGKVRLEDLKKILFCKGECMKESEINELLKKFTDRDGNINYNTLISSLLGQ